MSSSSSTPAVPSSASGYDEPAQPPDGWLRGRPHVVVVGAGFAGLDCAKRLARAPVAVTIVDRHNFHTFQPLLYQVATSGLAPDDVAYPVRGIFQRNANVRFLNAVVVGVDWNAKTLSLNDGSRLGFDYLVLAVGASTNWLRVKGAERYGLPLYTLSDALRLRNHLLTEFEEASRVGAGRDDPRLRLVVIGGGPTGVEMAGALVELLRVVGKDFPELDLRPARVVLVEAVDRVLSPFSRQAQGHALEQLEARGVELHLGEAVDRVDRDGVHLRSGRTVNTRTVVWAAGVRANPLADALGLEQSAGGRIVVSPALQVTGHPWAFAVGDLAAIPGADGQPLPQLAPVAKQSGRFAAEQILRLVRGRTPRRFHYHDRGTMATIGRSSAVADLPLGIHLTGLIGWLAWLCLHLWFLIGFRNRLSVLLNWSWNYLTYDRGPRNIIPVEPGDGGTAREHPQSSGSSPNGGGGELDEHD